MLSRLFTVFGFLSILSLTPCFSADYYWIGGSGDWSEISHWATSSGGSVTYSQTPTANDNVIFDQNSFTGPGQIVTINNGIAFCRNFTFTNLSFNPTFRAMSGIVLNVYGSIQLSASMTFDFRGDIVLASSDTGNTINFIAHNAAQNFRIEGTGSWTFQNRLTVVDRIEIVRGTVDFGAALITARYLISDNTNPRNVNFRDAAINLTGMGNIVNPFWLSDPGNIYTLKINTTNWTSSAGNGLVDLDNETAHLFMSGNGTLNLPALTISNNQGRTVWYNEFFGSTININGDLTIRHDANIQTALRAANLVLSPGKLYEFLSGGVYNFTALQANGDCANLINMLGNPAGSTARLNFNNAFTASFLILRDIQANGPGSVAQNSINLGNNPGWNITEKSSENFYWIGRNGNWHNPSNWSLTSGGAPSGCLPTLADNVIFDTNSFTAANQFVSIGTNIAYCRDMNWMNVVNGSGITGAEDERIFINGNLTLANTMNNNFMGEIHMVGSGNFTINTNGIQIRNALFLNNSTGNWTLSNPLFVQRLVSFMAGGFNTGGYNLDLNRFISESATARTLLLNNSQIYIRDRNFRAGEFYMLSDNLTLDAGTSHIIFGLGGTGVFNIYGATSLRFYDVSYENFQGNFYASSTVFPPVTYHFNNVSFKGEGYIAGDFRMQVLTLEGGNEYIIQHGTEISLERLETNANCNGIVSINTAYYIAREDKPKIEFRTAQSLTGVSLKNITATGMIPVTATGSIDRGGNTGFTIVQDRNSRVLYWVGNSGSWFDPQHWSLTSGGPGGQCIPTELDDVIIDANSFNTTTGYIDGGNVNLPTAFCRNFLFNKAGLTSFSIRIRQMNVHGDYRLNYPVESNVSFLVMAGERQDQTIAIPGNELIYLYVKSGRKVTALTPLRVFGFSVFEGTFDSNGQLMDIRDICFLGNGIPQIRPEVFFRNSTISIHGRSLQYNEALTVQNHAVVHADSSYIILDNNISGMEIRSSDCRFGTMEGVRNQQFNVLTYGNVNVRKMILTGNGNFESQRFAVEGRLTADTLILTAGKSYVFQSTRTHVINRYLKARGNNCNPISVRASISNQKSVIQMPAIAVVDADFVQMQDMRGVGGATFNAGPYSTNIAMSNENWIFPGVTSIDATVGFLGPDKFLCPELPSIVLDANNFTSEETYLWSTGSTSPGITVSAAGTYAVTVTFGNNCIVIDTIRILNADNPGALLPNDTTLCNAAQFTINPMVRPAGSTIQWSTGSSADQITVSQSGQYAVNMTSQGCTFRDTIRVTFVQTNAFSLGPDRTGCEGDAIVLTATYPGGTILWNTGSTQNQITATTSGTYSVQINDGPCIIRDTVVVTFNPIPVFSLGRDTSICEGQTITFSTGLTGISAVWQDGSTAQNYTTDRAGMYSAVVTRNGCSYADTLNLTLRPLPAFSLGNDTTLCEGEILLLTVNIPGATISWFDSTLGSQTVVSSSGNFSATAVLNGCTFEDEIKVQFITVPKPDLGRDTTICEGERIVLSVVQGDLDYRWNTGSTQNSINVTQAGNYSVTVGKGNCTQSDTVNVSVAPLPTVVLEPELRYCKGESIQAMPFGNFDTFIWNDQPGPPNRTFNMPGMYQYRAILGSCTRAAVLNVIEKPLPTLDLGPDFEACLNDNPTLNVGGQSFDSILWNDGSTLPSLPLTTSGEYSVQVMVGGCTARDTVNVSLLNCADEILVFPNIFKPNSASGNAFFGPVINKDFTVQSFQLSVFDRFGNLVYYTDSIDRPWDGTFKNTEVSTGVFVYLCRLDASGPRVIKDAVYKGSITLVY
ncbi:MAG: gliding motility-associated C-terminal domain-containing protein [Saprospiraceae bacterium]|nr:gliding motility-associated C-terminal domain-containing protein [Saprospiraceae bacterium]